MRRAGPPVAVALAAVVASARRTLEPVLLEDRDVRRYGPTAVTTARATVRGTLRGRAFALVARHTNVFVHDDGRWRAVAAQVTTQD